MEGAKRVWTDWLSCLAWVSGEWSGFSSEAGSFFHRQVMFLMQAKRQQNPVCPSLPLCVIRDKPVRPYQPKHDDSCQAMSCHKKLSELWTLLIPFVDHEP
jgi:hypothetical protein